MRWGVERPERAQRQSPLDSPRIAATAAPIPTTAAPIPTTHPPSSPAAIPAPLRHSYLSVIPAPPSVIPAQAGTTHLPPHFAPPAPQFIPPPFQGGGEVGGGTPRTSTTPVPLDSPRIAATSARSPPLIRHSRRRRHSCAGRNPPMRRRFGLSVAFGGAPTRVGRAVGMLERVERWEAADSCLRRNDGKGAGTTEEGAGVAVRTGWATRLHAWGGGSRRPTPHLTSPLEGGRDELGRRGRKGRRAARGEGELGWKGRKRRRAARPPPARGRDELGGGEGEKKAGSGHTAAATTLAARASAAAVGVMLSVSAARKISQVVA